VCALAEESLPSHHTQKLRKPFARRKPPSRAHCIYACVDYCAHRKQGGKQKQHTIG